jgi:hypothetical protein
VDPRAPAKSVSLAAAFNQRVDSVDSVNSGGSPTGTGSEPDDRSGAGFGGKPYV